MTDLMAMPEQKAKTTRFLPGDRTLYDDVRLVIPNVELELSTGRTHRYWPHASLPATTREDVFEAWDEYFENYAAHLSEHEEVVLGLAGGVDSRGMIAVLRSKGLAMRYESSGETMEEESSQISGIVEHIGGEHRWIDIRRWIKTMKAGRSTQKHHRAAGYTRGTPTMPTACHGASRPGGVSVYGHGGGVTARTVQPPRQSSCRRILSSRLLSPALGRTADSIPAVPRAANRQAFQEFVDRADYGADLYGVDPGLLLYWEHRMANWASLQIAVHSIGMNAHAGINSRRLYAAFWGLSGSAHDKTLHAELIAA